MIAYSISGDEFWQAPVDASVNYLMSINDARGSEIIVGTGANSINRLNNKGTSIIRLARYLDSITSLDQIVRDERLLPVIIAGLEDGTLRSLSTRGNQNWQTTLDGIATKVVPANDSIYLSTDEEEIMRIDFDGEIIWRLSDMGRTSSMFWGDLDGDVRPDVERNGGGCGRHVEAPRAEPV